MAGKTIGHLKKDERTLSKKKEDFLLCLAEYASVSRAATKSKNARSNIYEWLKKDIKFKAAFEEACDVATKSLEDEAIRRAYEGVNKPVFQGGKKVGTIKEYSDTLLIVLLKARDPDRYKDRSAKEITGKDGKPIATEVKHEIIFKDYSDDDTD